jgi:hypothetical protein
MTENEPKTRKCRKEIAEDDDNTEVVKPRKEKRNEKTERKARGLPTPEKKTGNGKTLWIAQRTRGLSNQRKRNRGVGTLPNSSRRNAEKETKEQE